MMTRIITLSRDGEREVTVADFDRLVDVSPDSRLLELVAGAVVMMSNPTEAHEQIASNIGAPLKLAMDRRRCRTYQGGMRVQRDDNVHAMHKPKPDVLVRCGEATNRGTYVTDPIIVVEVLSPSTMDIDRGPKREFYISLPSVEHVVLVYQDQMRVEHYVRNQNGFDMNVLTHARDTLRLAAVGFELALDQIYFDVPVV
jgi:Uma2 family endonuclease